jgi:lipopolysaccharide/colanic/teichoic acid biosynthesis glycosyltransferase
MLSDREIDVTAVTIPALAGAPLAGLSPCPQPHRFYDRSKRALDFGLGLTLLAAALPVILLAAFAVVVSTRSNPLFRQQRIGHCGRSFTVFKLKTMRDRADEQVPVELNETDGPTFKSKVDPRITPVGRLLRRTSIDELPQFLNVVLGQMSLVGPRPPLLREVVRYSYPQLQRLTVKPGVTGFWQVSGRSDIPFRTWMAMDRVYVRNRSLLVDLALLARTPWAVLSARGAV